MAGQNGSDRAPARRPVGTVWDLYRLRGEAIAEVRRQLAQGRLWTEDTGELGFLVDVIVAVEVLILDGHKG